MSENILVAVAWPYARSRPPATPMPTRRRHATTRKPHIAVRMMHLTSEEARELGSLASHSKSHVFRFKRRIPIRGRDHFRHDLCQADRIAPDRPVRAAV